MFFRNFSPSLVGKSPSLVSINEGPLQRLIVCVITDNLTTGSIEIDESSSVEEDDWILEYAMSLVEPQPVMLLQVGGKNEQAGKSFQPLKIYSTESSIRWFPLV